MIINRGEHFICIGVLYSIAIIIIELRVRELIFRLNNINIYIREAETHNIKGESSKCIVIINNRMNKWEKIKVEGGPLPSFGHTATTIHKTKVILFGGAAGEAGKYNMTGETYLYNIPKTQWIKIEGTSR